MWLFVNISKERYPSPSTSILSPPLARILLLYLPWLPPFPGASILLLYCSSNLRLLTILPFLLTILLDRHGMENPSPAGIAYGCPSRRALTRGKWYPSPYRAPPSSNGCVYGLHLALDITRCSFTPSFRITSLISDADEITIAFAHLVATGYLRQLGTPSP